MPDLDDILLALGTLIMPVGVGLAAGAFLGSLVGVGAALIVLGLLALAGGVLLGRSAPTGKAP